MNVKEENILGLSLEDIQAFLSLFSPKNILSRKNFTCLTIILCIAAYPPDFFDNLLMAYTFNSLIVYVTLLSIQKRCRDFGNSGTWWILAYSLICIISSTTYFTNFKEDVSALNYFGTMASIIYNIIYMLQQDNYFKYAGYITAALYLFILPLFIIPSKPDADINLTSPLMKHPVIYTAVCFVLCIAATWTVNHYYGINIELF